MLFHLPQHRRFHGSSRHRSAWRTGCFVLWCRRPRELLEASVASGGGAYTWHFQRLQMRLNALHPATTGDKLRRKSGEEAHRLPLPYACIWRLLAADEPPASATRASNANSVTEIRRLLAIGGSVTYTGRGKICDFRLKSPFFVGNGMVYGCCRTFNMKS